MAVHAVVIAGGRGERFWPASRRARPKPFLPLVSDRSMLAETLARLDGLVDRRWIVVPADLEAAARAETAAAGGADVVAEPEGRNTAAAIGLAAVRALAEDPAAVLLVCPADHHVPDASAFRTAMRAGLDFAATNDALVCFGIAPTRPETGYGWIRIGEEVARGVRRVAAFVEKPDRARAEALLAAGGHLWNGGIFAFRAAVLLDEIGRFLPRTRAALATIAAAGRSEGEEIALAQAYRGVEGVSIDVGVMERSDRVFVVPVSFSWDDVGAWSALARLLPRGPDGTAARGTYVGHDCADLVVSTDSGVVAAVGVRDLVVVRAGDAVLVCPKGRDQEVRDLLRRLADAPGGKDLL